jgi:hypothetical protein
MHIYSQRPNYLTFYLTPPGGFDTFGTEDGTAKRPVVRALWFVVSGFWSKGEEEVNRTL